MLITLVIHLHDLDVGFKVKNHNTKCTVLGSDEESNKVHQEVYCELVLFCAIVRLYRNASKLIILTRVSAAGFAAFISLAGASLSTFHCC